MSTIFYEWFGSRGNGMEGEVLRCGIREGLSTVDSVTKLF